MNKECSCTPGEQCQISHTETAETLRDPSNTAALHTDRQKSFPEPLHLPPGHSTTSTQSLAYTLQAQRSDTLQKGKLWPQGKLAEDKSSVDVREY